MECWINDKRQIGGGEKFRMGVAVKPLRFRASSICGKDPFGALVVLLPEDDPELSRVNLAIAKKRREAGQPVVHVHFKKSKLASSLVKPRLEIIEL